MQKIKAKLKKLFSLDFWLDALAGFLRGLIKKNPIGFFHKTFNKKHPYWSIGISVFFIAIIFAGLLYFFLPKNEVSAAWWNDTWGYRKAITVANSSGSTLTDFQVKILDNKDLSADITAGKIQSDLDDLRFTDINGSLLPYWIEDSTGSSVDVWTKLASIPTTGATVYMYYGNSSVSAYNNSNGMTTGGTVTTISGYRIHTFTSNGTFATGPLTSVESLVVAGGGGGGSSQAASGGGGGGGAGGLIYNASLSVAQGQSLPVIIGNGGSPGTTGANQAGSNGENSVFGSLSAIGGGGGARTGVNGSAGGSGGGGGYNGYATVRNGGAGTSGQGSSGGSTSLLAWAGGAGGGGAGGVGGDNKINHGGGDRGAGLAYSISGSSVTYATGGAGGANSPAASPANTGKGGDAAYAAGTAYAGGSGVVIVRYAVSSEPVAGTPATEEKSQGPIAYWSFDEGTGTTANDGTSNNNDGTISGAVWKSEAECVSGKCLWFDETGDNINLGGNDELTNNVSNITISAWVRLNANLGSFSDNYEIISNESYQNYGYLFRVQNTTNPSTAGGIHLRFSQAGASTYITAPANSYPNDKAWHHLVGIKDGSSGRIYLDGKLIHSGSGLSNPVDATTNTYIGGNGQLWNGFLDEVKVFPYARTANQIQQEYNAGLAGIGTSEGVSVSAGDNSPKWLSDGLVGHWKMDEASWGSVVDSSGNGNTGTAVGGATVGTGKFGNGGSFDGTDDYVSVANGGQLSVTNNLTVAAWVKNIDNFSGETNGNYIISKANQANPYNDYKLSLTSSYQYNFFIYTDQSSYSVTTASSFNDSNFHNVIGVYDKSSSQLKIYVDGKLEGTATASGNIRNTNNNFFIGDWNGSSTWHFWKGSVDDIRIYNRTFSPQEVADLYNYAPGPVGHWKMDDVIGTTVSDASENQKNGSFSGSPSWIAGKYGGALSVGASNYATVADDSVHQMLNNSFSVSSWIRTTGNSNYFLRKVNGQEWYYQYVNPSGLHQCGTKDGTTEKYLNSTGKIINDGNWHYASCVWDRNANLLRNYVDGIQITTSDIAGFGSVDNSSALNFGSGVTGDIDDVKIYNYARTPKQITEDMNAGHPAGGSPVGSQVGYWKFDEGYGGTAYNSGSGGVTLNGNLGVGSSAPAWTNDGKFGKALIFGANQYITPPNDPLKNFTLLTISAWVKPSSATYIFQHGSSSVHNGYLNYFRVNADGSVVLDIEDAVSLAHFTPASAGGVVSMNNWNYVSTVVRNNVVEFYVNGKKVYTSGTFNGMYALASTADTNRNIGRYYYNSGTISYSSGIIDEIKIYNGALTDDEIKLDYDQGKSLALGSSGTTATGTSSNSADRAYCPPGDTTASCGPIAEWKFDEMTGSYAEDTSGSGNRGTLQNSPAWLAVGKYNSGLNFNGSGKRVTVATPFGQAGYATASLWYKRSESDASTSWRTLLGHASANIHHLIINSSTRNLGIWDGAWKDFGYNPPNDGNWHHFEIIYNSGTNATLYVDGVYKNQISTTLDLATNPIGSIGNWGSSTYWAGPIDDVKIYNYARTPSQIAWDYNRGKPVGHWKMDEGEGATAYDHSGNGNNGTLTNMDPATDWVTGKLNKALDFDGGNDHVITNNQILSSGDMTISAWFRPETFPSDWAGVGCFQYHGGSSGTGWQITPMASSVKLVVGRTGANYNTNTFSGAVPTNTWSHILATYSSGVFKVYLNGKKIGSDWSQSVVYNGAGDKVHIGRWAWDYDGYYFDGQIDDVRVYNYALTAEQIKQVMNEGAVNFR